MAELEQSEKEAWLNARSNKIETAINTLRGKQALEMTALQKKIKAGLDELLKERNKEKNRISKKYENLIREQRSVHDK